MAIQDSLGTFDDAVAITASRDSTNVVDIGAVSRDIGPGEPIYINIQWVTADATAAGAATLTVSLATGATTALGTSILITPVLAKATLVIGYIFPIVVIPTGTWLRYIGLEYVVATGPLTAGAISASISSGPHQSNLLGGA